MEKSKMKSEKETNSRENKQKAGYSQHASPNKWYADLKN